MTWRGYQARIWHDSEDDILVGRIIGIPDRVGFHAETVAALREAFCEAVDDYLDTCARVGKAPQQGRLAGQ